MAVLQLKGTKESAKLNNILVFVKLAEILIFIILIAGHIDTDNYHPFMPFGWSGVFSGAAVVFFAFLGYDAIANSAGRSEKSAEKYAYWYYRVAYNSYGALYDSNAHADRNC